VHAVTANHSFAERWRLASNRAGGAQAASGALHNFATGADTPPYAAPGAEAPGARRTSSVAPPPRGGGVQLSGRTLCRRGWTPARMLPTLTTTSGPRSVARFSRTSRAANYFGTIATPGFGPGVAACACRYRKLQFCGAVVRRVIARAAHKHLRVRCTTSPQELTRRRMPRPALKRLERAGLRPSRRRHVVAACSSVVVR
jgi:hypothetical protein